MVFVDASHGEGGGQLVRSAVALAALTGKPLRLSAMRARRAKPGLAPQHLAAVRAVAQLCGARCEGLELRSTELHFEPGMPVAGGALRVDVGTAGSVTLVLQALLPALFCAPGESRVVVTGGTDVRQAPSWDYFCTVLLPLLRRMGLDVDASLVRRGYYPRGGGEVVVKVRPGVPRPLLLPGPAQRWRILGEAHVANLPLEIAERMRNAALDALGARGRIEARVLSGAAAVGTGGAVTLRAEGEGGLLGASRIAERGVRAEALGQSAGAELAADMAAGATLDVHAADQVLVYLALAKGPSSFAAREVSMHARTAMWLIEQFLPARFRAEGTDGFWRVRAGG